MGAKVNQIEKQIPTIAVTTLKVTKETTENEIAYTHRVGPDDKPRLINVEVDSELLIH
jgi:hypothetical protein